MSDNSKIAWCDATWNPLRGCTRMTPSGPRWTGKVELIESALEMPLRWRKPRRIFVMSDLFHEAAPPASIDRIFSVIARCAWHTFLVLMRADRVRHYAAEATSRYHQWKAAKVGHPWPLAEVDHVLAALRDWPPVNVWWVVSAEDQVPWLTPCDAERSLREAGRGHPAQARRTS